jgi:hypothetical protein
MIGVGNQSLRMEDIAANEFPNCHSEVGNQANPRDSDSSVAFVRRGEVNISVMMMVMVRMTPVATVLSGLSCHE